MVSNLFERLKHEEDDTVDPVTGEPAERPMGLMAFWAGLGMLARQSMTQAEFEKRFGITDPSDKAQIVSWAARIRAGQIDQLEFLQTLVLAEAPNKSEPGIPPGQRFSYYDKAKMRAVLQGL